MGSNRHALNRLLRRELRNREAEWLAEHLEALKPRDPAIVAAEDQDIKRRREAFRLH